MNLLLPLIAGILMPTAHVDIGVSAKQMKFGNVEHDGAIGVVETKVEWYGLKFHGEWVYDEQGARELTIGPGYGETFFDLLTADVRYLYCGHPERVGRDTQFVVSRLQGEFFLRPSIEWWMDTDENKGASYWSADIGHTFKATNRIKFGITAGTGIGNRQRNSLDTGHSSFGFKDVHVKAVMKYALTENIGIVPWASVYHRFHRGDDGCDAVFFNGGLNFCINF